MPHRLGTAARTAVRPALLLTLSVLLSLILPTGTSQASATGPAGTTAAAEDCTPLPLSAFGEVAPAEGTVQVPGEGAVCFTVDVEQPGLHRLIVSGAGTENTYPSVFDGETEVDCYDPRWGAGWCDLGHEGAYTLKLYNNWPDPSRPTVALTPLRTDEGCSPETGTAWDSAPLTGSAAGPTAIQCQPFAAKPGERITSTIRTTVSGGSGSWITDGTGAHICPRFNEDDSDGCVLPGDGPYRVLSQVSDAERGYPAEYTLKIRRLSEPAGCASVPLNTYGSAPTAAGSATGCKTFQAPAAGRYDVYGVGSSSRTTLAVYDREGKTVCTTWSGCSLPAAGAYTVLTDDSTLIIDRSSADGCVPAEPGLYTSAFTAVGEIDCLALPFPAGARMAVLKPLSGSSPRADVIAVDADGVQRCEGSDLSGGTCELTGKAPFRLLVSTDSEEKPTGDYTFALHRTDAASGCPAVPAGDFSADSPTARFSTGEGVFSRCLSIPADDHSARENLQLQATPGTTSTAQFSVLDADGKQVCSIYSSLSTWTTCALAPGVAHTVLVTGRDTAAEYTLTRRDVTSTAKGCTANPAAEVGGPSTGGTMGAPGALVCRQVTTADAKDTLHLDVRDALGTANVVAYGADGEALCNKNQACAVTGSTRYQVLVTVRTGLKAAPSYRFDALRVATATGPADECVKVPNVSYGYGPVTGTLDEQHSAVCAALPTAYNDRFDMKISDTAGATTTAVPALYDASLDNGCMRYIPSGYECYVNEPYGSDDTSSILVLSLPETASQTSYSAEAVCKSIRCGPEKVTVGAVTPATGATGSKVTLQVTGTALHEDDTVRIYRSGKTVEATTTSVSADRRTLTAVLDLTGAAVDTWSLSVVTHNAWEYGKGSFTVTAAPLANLTAPAISGTGKVGATLTAGTGTWSGGPSSYTYQWNADGKPVTGATASSYVLPASLLGKKVTVTVNARRSGTPDMTGTSAAVVVAQGAAPKATTAPKVTGTVRVGSKLTAVPGVWSPAATSYTYQWKADGKAVAGATASTYTAPASLQGKKLSVTVTARRTGHTAGAATTTAVTVAKGAAPKATKAPTVSGTAKVGKVLKVARGTWTPAPSSYTYQWYAGGKAIKGATKTSLTLRTAQKDKKITVKVTARRTGHSDGSAVSKATKAVVR
ncbi:hypothetical protein [Streptomyces sp. HB132]|uniref:hypothetical protein n=1 Tax=Streptomyces sp. HB132 TaxID=767388 RepID=UPI0019616E90|nr:hypothetical protein [Streptomyces sp. HB132]MBM7441510.1 hypothetical protein [Streptomyces sp. HB132]